MQDALELDLNALARSIWGLRWREGKYFAMIAPLLSSYLDESADKKKREAFCVGGILIHEENLSRIRHEWTQRVHRAGIPYFRYADCKGLHGAFLSYRKRFKDDASQEADRVLKDLEDILLSAPWGGFSAAVLVSEYIGILSEFPAAKHIFREDPTESAYGQMFYEIARQVRRNAKGFQVAYFIDESSDYSKIYDMFQATKINHPIIGKTMKTIAPLNDKETPALQMADLVTGMIRDEFIAWVQSGRPQRALLDAKWNGHVEPTWIWDRPHMLRIIRATLNSHKLKTGKIATRPLRKLSGAELRRQEKARRKQLVKGVR